MATVVAMHIIAVTLVLPPAARLAWATPLVVGHVLILALVVSCLVEYAVTVVAYRRDRVAAEAAPADRHP
jgi:hypothetical protein